MTPPLLVASEADTNEWGSVTCGAVMSLHRENSGTEPSTNSPINVDICLKNVSDKLFSVVRTSDPLTDFSFEVTSPSGKNVSPKKHSYQPSSPRFSDAIKPGEVFSFPKIDFRSVCELKVSGSYKVVAKTMISSSTGQSCEVASNPLNVSVK